ncbi:VOC family protein [Pendulispora rubella]|uniref:VOC family protein n=1 Tax=Pendulispora rubella TaxID=2741070 RepID=A0ABZ2KZA5_9BACT
MQLNHADLQVSNVPETAAFLERHFDFEIQTNRNSAAVIVLSDRRGFVLVLQRKKDDAETYPAGFHIGFRVDDVAIVLEKRTHLLESGVEHVGDILENNRGVMFYFHLPGDILCEVSCPKPLPVAPSRA